MPQERNAGKWPCHLLHQCLRLRPPPAILSCSSVESPNPIAQPLHTVSTDGKRAQNVRDMECRTMGNPLPSLETSSFDGRAQARSGLFRTEGPASMARKLAHHPEPLRSSFMATMRKPTQTRSAQAESAEAEAVPQDGRARSEGSAPEQATDSGSAADTQPPSETPVQTRFSITEAVPLPHVVHTDESAPVTAEE